LNGLRASRPFNFRRHARAAQSAPGGRRASRVDRSAADKPLIDVEEGKMPPAKERGSYENSPSTVDICTPTSRTRGHAATPPPAVSPYADIPPGRGHTTPVSQGN
jgi:hypothetical protein